MVIFDFTLNVFCFPCCLLVNEYLLSSLSEIFCLEHFSPVRIILSFVSKLFALKLDFREFFVVASTSGADFPTAACPELNERGFFSSNESAFIVDLGLFTCALSCL